MKLILKRSKEWRFMTSHFESCCSFRVYMYARHRVTSSGWSWISLIQQCFTSHSLNWTAQIWYPFSHLTAAPWTNCYQTNMKATSKLTSRSSTRTKSKNQTTKTNSFTGQQSTVHWEIIRSELYNQSLTISSSTKIHLCLHFCFSRIYLCLLRKAWR